MRHLTILAGGLAGSLAASAALAVPGTATGDVNLRADATVNAQRLATIPAGARVEVHGCPSWCNVTFDGITGWASSNYIATGVASRDRDYDRDRYDRGRYGRNRADRGRYERDRYNRGPRYSYQRAPAPPRVYWEFGEPRWDDRHGFWRDRRDRWWHDGRWHRQRPGGVTFQFGF
jgi:uncharacterized protein YraI